MASPKQLSYPLGPSRTLYTPSGWFPKPHACTHRRLDSSFYLHAYNEVFQTPLPPHTAFYTNAHTDSLIHTSVDGPNTTPPRRPRFIRYTCSYYLTQTRGQRAHLHIWPAQAWPYVPTLPCAQPRRTQRTTWVPSAPQPCAGGRPKTWQMSLTGTNSALKLHAEGTVAGHLHSIISHYRKGHFRRHLPTTQRLAADFLYTRVFPAEVRRQ